MKEMICLNCNSTSFELRDVEGTFEDGTDWWGKAFFCEDCGAHYMDSEQMDFVLKQKDEQL